MGSQKKEAILQTKWAVSFVQKAKWAKNELWVSGLHGSSHFLLVQPSSAAAERVFSILRRFTAQQQSSLEDYLELSIMLQYNLAH